MDQRRAEIDAKRARLEEMRRRRELKEKEKGLGPPVASRNWESVVRLVASVPKAVRYSKATQTDSLDLQADREVVVDGPQEPAGPSEPQPQKPAGPSEPQPQEPAQPSEPAITFTTSDHFDTQRASIFLQNGFRVIERLQAPDPLIKYHQPTQKTAAPLNIQQLLQLPGTLTVTSIDLSPHHPKLIACAYSGTNSITSRGGSCVRIWSQDFPQSPEYTLKSPTDLTKIRFSASNSWIVYGAGYNGQIYIWDLRHDRHDVLPALRTVADANAGHFLPICALLVAPNLNHDVLVSLSVDGNVCMWPSDQLVNPTSRVSLVVPNKTQTISSTCMCLHHTDSSLFLVGTLDGTIYTGRRVDSVGAKAGVSEHPVYRGHTAPVTTVEYHPLCDDHVFISASLDWSVRVWTGTGTDNKSLEISLIDAVTAVSWSPHFACVFVCLCRNTIQVWNLATSVEEPVAEFEVEELATAVAWDPQIKGRLVCGFKGETVVLSVQEGILEGAWDDSW